MMDSFELTKIAAAILTALLVIFGVRTFVEIRTGGHGHGETHVGYTLPVAKKAAAPAMPATAPAAAAFDAAKVAAAAASGNAAAGQEVFKKCAACHTAESGGAAKVGPNLHGIVGKAKTSTAGFGYSEVLKAKGGSWALPDLATFLYDPKGYAAGTKMVFGGVKDPGELANLLAYLATLK